ACNAFTDEVLENARKPNQRASRRLPKINTLGLLEVDGMVAAIDAADAMLKAANVRLLSHEVLDPGRLTLVVEGDLAACRAALDAGCAAAMRTGRVISLKEIVCLVDVTQRLITSFNRQPE